MSLSQAVPTRLQRLENPCFAERPRVKHTHESSWVCIANQPDSPANTEARPHKAVRYYSENRIEVLPQFDVTHVHESLNEAQRARKCQAARQCPNRQPQTGNQLTVFGNKKGTPQGPLGISNGVGGGT